MPKVKQISMEEEYKKNPDISPEDIRKLREWLKTQPHLPNEYVTDLDLLLTFHCCERSAEVTKQVFDLHLTLRTLFNGFFQNRVMDQRLQMALDTVLISPLPTPTVHGYRALYGRLLSPDHRNFIFSDVVKLFMMIFDLWQYEEGTWPGFVLIIDMDQTTIGHLGKLDVMSIRQVLYFLQECMLVKLKEVHFLNAPYFMDKLMMLLKPFMKKALLDIIRIHQRDTTTLEQFVKKSSLPKDEGGEYLSRSTLKGTNESIEGSFVLTN
ncbi:clavesin-2-like isoform X1 [Zerene cesonia]|uniref:clavesin-2-like isoform X1 n=1 Tax=Zerene cesonia TaxID=33412 RepID=UPI0018E55237|nr:clavesin-2-like isoform X1 [Zerene cesonia]